MPYSASVSGGLLSEIDGLGGRLLHLERQLVAGDPGGQLGVVGARGAMGLVLLAQAIEQPAAGGPVGAVGDGQVEDRLAVGAQDRALVGGRHVAARPVLGPADRPAGVVEHDDEAGQVLVLAAQAVVDPRAQAGMPDRIRPVFICSMAEPWIGESAYIEWTKAMSSTHVARCGNRSETILPHWPYWRKCPLRADDPALVLLAAAAERLDLDRLAVEAYSFGL